MVPRSRKRQKTVEKSDRGDRRAFMKFENYGVSRDFYHHPRMVNYSKEMKSKLRKMTGVATDLMDLIDIYEGEPSITGKKRQS
ncbi:hypothetical protein JTE90_025272 [Oedothorax gibbosus]|uniref:Uncharacterized protein n=1 Tax=Oedothorax gibbosus TaxID=931172 RepID=A0AAV6U8M9_9ARAC|nr:hypothetical protein JTE90_025272 [Oedothorax gibbosus]